MPASARYFLPQFLHGTVAGLQLQQTAQKRNRNSNSDPFRSRAFSAAFFAFNCRRFVDVASTE